MVDKVTLFALLNALPKYTGIVHWNKRKDYKRNPLRQAEETVHGRIVKQHTKKVFYVLILIGINRQNGGIVGYFQNGGTAMMSSTPIIDWTE